MKRLFIPMLLMGLMTMHKADAAIWFVNQSATGSGTGTSWLNAFTDLEPAITAASSGDTIWVAKGIYYPTRAADGISTDNRDKSFVLKDGVAVYGGFAGTESSLSERQTDSLSLYSTYPTILSGDLGVANDSTDNAYHVVIATGLNNFTLDGFSIRNGNANGTTPLMVNGRNIYRHYGGAVYNDSASGSYRYLLIEHNTAHSFDDTEGGGGGMYSYKGAIIVEHAFFINNRAENCNGGAMKNYTSNISVSHTAFYQNVSMTTDEGGGAINNKEQSNGSFTNVLFKSNRTNASGGGVYNDNSDPQFTQVVFESNEALSCGGGLDTDNGSDAILNEVSFINNYAAEDGGGLFGWKSSASLTNVSFTGNHADNNGGGMYNYNTCNPEITNAVFTNNSAGNDYGGFGLERNSTAVLTNVLISKNTAVRNGGGMGCHDNHSTAATAILTNVTVVNNSAANGGGGYDYGTTTQIRNSIIAGNYPNDVDINPLLVGNAKYIIIGGTPSPVYIIDGSSNPIGTPVSWPFFADTLTGNYKLALNSPAIDAGDTSFYASSATPNLSNITTDLQHANRIMGNNIDIGAYEYCTQTVAPLASVSVLPNTVVSQGDTVTFSLTINSAGPQPVIYWYKNNTIITGASGISYTAVAGTDFMDNDSIYAVIYSSDPCASPDSVITNGLVMTITPTSVATITNGVNNLNIFPNPTQGSFVVKGDFDVHKNYNMTIYSVTGQKVYNATWSNVKHPYRVDLPSSTPAGMYFLSVQENGYPQQVIRFVVE